MDPRYDPNIVPGTVHLVDIAGDLNVQKGTSGAKDIILQPQPSSNPNDPLRWSRAKKLKQFWLLWFLSFMLAVSVNWSGPIWVVWTEDFNCSFFDLNVSSALCFIFLGIGCLFLQPTAMKLGRRCVYLFCTVLVTFGNLLVSQATGVQHLYGSNIMCGFAAAPVDSLVEISTTDVFFQHERAEYLSWFILSLYAGSDLGPVACGYIVEHLSWRWCGYIQIIIFAVTLVVCLFYMEDTTFRRDYDSLQGEEEIMHQIKSRESSVAPQQVTEKSHVVIGLESDDLSDAASIASVDHSIPLRTYWQRMRLIETEYSDLRSWLTIFIRPFFLVSFPAVVWGGLIYGAQMMWLSLLATTQAEIYSYAPYNFSTPQTGLTNLGALVGSIIGMFYGGKFVDYLTVKLARRNNGIMEPEFRLWAMILPTILNAAGLLAYGLSSAYQAPWAVSVVVGQGCLGFAMGSSGSICLTYAIDSYPKLASEALVLMLFVRNCIGCGFTFAIQPWLDRNGLKLTTWLMFMLSLIINGSFILMIMFGKSFRRWTKERYYKFSDPMFGEFFKGKQ